MSGLEKTRAVILAGGKGTRLRPFTVVLPKPLVPIGEKSMIEILLSQLQHAGIQDVTVCTGYLSELIMAVCGKGEKYGLDIEYVHEENPLGTAGPLTLIGNLSDPFVVMNGDLLTDLDFCKLIEYHKDNNADITIAVHKREIKIDFGVVEMNENNEFSGFSEKPTYHHHVSMGVNVINPAVLKSIDRNEYFDMPDLIKLVHTQGGKVCCYDQDCYWLDIGRVDDYALAQEKFADNPDYFLNKKA